MTGPEPLVLRSEELEVELLPEVGCRIHRLRAFGHDLLRTPEDPDEHRRDPFFWGAYPMAPWCNRMPPGPNVAGGRTIDLPSNFGDGSVIHGQVSSRPWQREGDGTLRVTGGGAGDGWPWEYEVRLAASVSGADLRMDYSLENRSDAPMPAGLGLHPWFRAPLDVAVPASRVYPMNDGSPRDPLGVSGPHDLRRLRKPAPGLDGTWTGLDDPRIDLAWPDAGVELRIEIGAPAVLVALASPADLGAVAVEPQTHGPDPVRRFVRGEPDAPALLEPAETLRLQLTLAARRTLAP